MASAKRRAVALIWLVALEILACAIWPVACFLNGLHLSLHFMERMDLRMAHGCLVRVIDRFLGNQWQPH